MRPTLTSLLGGRVLNVRALLGAPLAYQPGHFFSPVCDPAELERRYRDPATVTPPVDLPGIDIAHDAQLALWNSWSPFRTDARAFAKDRPSQRYRVPSLTFGAGDAIIYSCMLRHLSPTRLIEVGSGSSSAVALDTFDQFFRQRPHCVFIDPYPASLRSFLTQEDAKTIEILGVGVQDIPARQFEDLQQNDLLFVDSTHVVKTGSDVLYVLFEILPRLRPGVVVHFHDVLYPFEYPREWVLVRNYSWNEAYALRAFLMGNRDWEIMFFNDYFVRAERALVERDAPEILQNPGGGLWLRRGS